MKYSASKLTMTAVSILLLAGCSTTPVATNSNLNTNVNVNNVANENTNVAVDGEVDTSDWKEYVDEDLGIAIKYPLDYTILSELTDYSDNTKYDPKNFGGQKKIVRITSMTNANHVITIEANTQDLKNMYESAFIGGPLEEYCSNAGIKTANSICLIVNLNDKQVIYKHKLTNMECSPRLLTSITLNNPNTLSNFTGLTFSQALPGVQENLFSSPYKDGDPCSGNIDIDKKLEAIFASDFQGNGLIEEDERQLNLMKTIITTIRVL